MNMIQKMEKKMTTKLDGKKSWQQVRQDLSSLIMKINEIKVFSIRRED